MLNLSTLWLISVTGQRRCCLIIPRPQKGSGWRRELGFPFLSTSVGSWHSVWDANRSRRWGTRQTEGAEVWEVKYEVQVEKCVCAWGGGIGGGTPPLVPFNLVIRVQTQHISSRKQLGKWNRLQRNVGNVTSHLEGQLGNGAQLSWRGFIYVRLRWR